MSTTSKKSTSKKSKIGTEEQEVSPKWKDLVLSFAKNKQGDDFGFLSYLRAKSLMDDLPIQRRIWAGSCEEGVNPIGYFLEAGFSLMVNSTCEMGYGGNDYFFRSDNSLVQVHVDDKSVTCTCTSVNGVDLDPIRTWTESHITKNEKKKPVEKAEEKNDGLTSVYFPLENKSIKGSHVDLKEIGRMGVPFKGGNYSAMAVAKFHKMAADLMSPSPMHRTHILHGQPGCGKKYFVKGLMNAQPKACYITLPAGHLKEIGTSAFTNMLLRKKGDFSGPFVLIVEGISNVEELQSEKSLLGFLGEVLDIRVIALSDHTIHNAEYDVFFEHLSSGQAGDIYKGLTNGEGTFSWEGSSPLSEVYRVASTER